MTFSSYGHDQKGEDIYLIFQRWLPYPYGEDIKLISRWLPSPREGSVDLILLTCENGMNLGKPTNFSPLFAKTIFAFFHKKYRKNIFGFSNDYRKNICFSQNCWGRFRENMFSRKFFAKKMCNKRSKCARIEKIC